MSPPLASTLLKQSALHILTRVARRVNNLATVVFGHHRLLKDGGDGVSKRHLKGDHRTRSWMGGGMGCSPQ